MMKLTKTVYRVHVSTDKCDFHIDSENRDAAIQYVKDRVGKEECNDDIETALTSSGEWVDCDFVANKETVYCLSKREVMDNSVHHITFKGNDDYYGHVVHVMYRSNKILTEEIGKVFKSLAKQHEDEPDKNGGKFNRVINETMKSFKGLEWDWVMYDNIALFDLNAMK